MDRPLLSICIPTYNRADYLLKECLNSIVNQFDNDEICRQVEIVISDNASTDNTEAVVRGYQEKFSNIKYFKHGLAVTPALNWDNAVKNSCGKYINTIGDDDIYLPDSLSKLLPLLSTAESRLIIVTHVSVIDGIVQLPDNYSGNIMKVLTENIAEDFFNFNAETKIKNMSLIPPLLFFSGNVAREVRNTTGYFWKDPIGDHWAIFSVLCDQPFMVFYDFPVVGYRVHANNHLAIKYKKKKMKELLETFLALHNKNFNLFPGPSFTNLGYVGMQDIQHHFSEYKKFHINTDQGLSLHISNLLHTDFPIIEKGQYLFKSFCLVKHKRDFLRSDLFFRGLSFLLKKLKIKK